MNLLTITLRNIRQRLLSSSLTALSVALGVMLIVAVLVINTVVGDSFNQRGVGANLVIGPKGSDLTNVLAAVYRIGTPGEPLPHRFLSEDLLGKQSEWKKYIEYAIPMTMGDVTEQGAFPIIGTTALYFTVPYGPDRKFNIKGGLPNGVFDAVIGARVARENRWDLGSEFKLIHGGAESDHVHDEKFKVVGVLAPTGTANDRTVFVNMEGFFALAGHEKPPEDAINRLRKFGYEVTPAQEKAIRTSAVHDHGDHAGHDHAGHDHGHFHGLHDDLKEVSFILLRTKNTSQAIFIEKAINEGPVALAVNPVFPINRLMTSFVGNIRTVLLVLTGLIVAVSGIGIFVSIYNSMSDRRREIAILRALGAQRQTVFLIILCESLVLCLGGGLLGLLLGHGMVFAAAPLLTAEVGLVVDPLMVDRNELILFPVLLGMAVLVGFLPGLTAYRTDVAQSLSD